jgi:hypothetical protein
MFLDFRLLSGSDNCVHLERLGCEDMVQLLL